MFKIYHNPQCKKSRAGLEYLKSRGAGFEIVEYLKNPLTDKQLEVILTKLNLKPTDIVRKQEDLYKKSLRGKTFTDHAG